jgi:anti-anti-sigma factor
MTTGPATPLPPDLVLLRFDPCTGQAVSSLPARTIRDDDKSTINDIIEAAAANPRATFIVDMIGCTFCGTMRLGVLLRIHQALRKNGRLLRIAVDHPELQDVFRLTRLNTIMAVFASLEAAVDEAKRQP